MHRQQRLSPPLELIMKVFITGASGYIGSALTKELIAHGHTVLGLARSDASAAKLAALGAEVHRGNTDDLDSIRTAAAASDGVAHLAFDHDFSKYEASQLKDNETVEAIGVVLAGTNKPFVISSGTLITAFGGGANTEDDAAVAVGPGAGRARSEEMTVAFAAQGVRSAVVRLPPTVHGGDLSPTSFIRQRTGAAKKHGFAGYVGDGSARWPAAHVHDVAVLYRLALESGVPGRRYHAAADEGLTSREVAEAIGAHLGLPVKSVPAEEAMSHWGFLGMIMSLDNPTPSALTRERLGWKPTYPSMLEELKAGKYFD
jgi:nucleoside-diphosphate-sugar epimerase